MHLYRVISDTNELFFRSFKDVKAAVKDVTIFPDPAAWTAQRVRISTDSASIVAYLNRLSPECVVVQTWDVTKRRALKKVKE